MDLPRTRADQWDVQQIVKVRVNATAQATCVCTITNISLLCVSLTGNHAVCSVCSTQRIVADLQRRKYLVWFE